MYVRAQFAWGTSAIHIFTGAYSCMQDKDLKEIHQITCKGFLHMTKDITAITVYFSK